MRVHRTADVALHLGDSLKLLKTWPSECIDAVVTDPPYGISFMGQEWDAPGKMLGQHSPNYHEKATHSRGYADNDNRMFQRWCTEWATECLRLLKPGGHLLAFGGGRTYHRLACAVEDAGFDIRDSLVWLYGQGFPKGQDIGRDMATVSPEAAAEWAGWNTTLKPAMEPIVMARKPFPGTVTGNVAAYGTGALNIGGCRIPHTSEADLAESRAKNRHADFDNGPRENRVFGTDTRDRGVNGNYDGAAGRWPTNVMLDEAVAESMGEQARFFYCPKASRAERPVVDGVTHMTVKPLALMRWLIRLVTPPDGRVLDPFAGSGTTLEAALLEGVKSVGVEWDEAHIPLIMARINRSS